jgi:hypothetical protein
MGYRTRDLLVRQRTQTINALRGHLAEYGVVAPVGTAHLGRLAALVEGEEGVDGNRVRPPSGSCSAACSVVIALTSTMAFATTRSLVQPA